MEFKLLLFCFGLLTVATSASSDCNCASQKKNVAKYNVKVSKDGETYNEEVEIDPDKETETVHIPKTSSSGGEVDIIFDIKKNMVMHRVAATNSCYLSNSTDNVPKPKDLMRLLDSANGGKGSKATVGPGKKELKVVGILHDRSILSDEMASLCAKLPIYHVKLVDTFVDKKDQDKTWESQSKRQKRQTFICHCCWHEYYLYCSYIANRCWIIQVTRCAWETCPCV